MKTLNELRAFCEGYRLGLITDRAFYGTTLAGVEDWVVWGGYDINLSGSEVSGHAKEETDLHVDAYPADWVDNLPEPIHSFTIGESK
jgi:hypothetical protein